MKCLGVDLGDVRTGLAISDSRGIVATGLESYNCKGAEEDLQHIVDAIVNNNIECCVIGYPINMNGTFWTKG